MIARYVQKGEAIDYRPTENVKAGTIFPFNGFVGITRLDIRAGELGALAVKKARILFPKTFFCAIII